MKIMLQMLTFIFALGAGDAKKTLLLSAMFFAHSEKFGITALHLEMQ